MLQDYAQTKGRSEYFHLDTTGTTAIAVNTFANWMVHNKGFLEHDRLISDAKEVKSIIPLNKFTFLMG